MKKLLVILLSSIMAISLIACSSSEKKDEVVEKKNETIEVIGDGEIYLVNQSGTTEDNNILYIMYDKDALMLQIGYESKGVDGSAPTVIYIDGEEVDSLQLGDSQGSIELSKANIDKGFHHVEFIQKDGDTTVFYRLAKYEVK